MLSSNQALHFFERARTFAQYGAHIYLKGTEARSPGQSTPAVDFSNGRLGGTVRPTDVSAQSGAAMEKGRLQNVKTRIYIVDDHPLIRRGLTALIGAESDMEVCGQAGDAKTGLKEIMKLQPELAIVDISLNGSSGLELIKSIKAYSSKIQILVLSMYDESLYALRVLKAGARAYVMKQDVIDKVIDAIRRVRNGDLYVSDDIANQMLDRVVAGESADDALPMAVLSDRELEVVNLIGSGFLTKEIAETLHVSVKTVETHRAHIKEKMNLSNATRLVQFCVRWVEENSASRRAIGAGNSFFEQ